MKILVLGGTGFIGPHVIRHLQAGGHRVAAIHRGPRATSLPPEVEHIVGDARQIAHNRSEIQSFAPDVLIDLILSSGNQAEALMQNVRGGCFPGRGNQQHGCLPRFCCYPWHGSRPPGAFAINRRIALAH